MEQKKAQKRGLWGWLEENGMWISGLIAIVFLASPFLLFICPCFYNLIDLLLEGLKYSEYKEAYIGAAGGMIGSFLAITGAVWIERKLLRDSEKRETEKLAVILYNDIEFFYDDISSLATKIKWILRRPTDQEKIKQYTICKTPIGIYIYSDWIGLVASLKDVLEKEEIKKIYEFYGSVSNIKSVIQKERIAVQNIRDIEKAINKVGTQKGNRYLPKEEYREILDHLKQIAGEKVH